MSHIECFLINLFYSPSLRKTWRPQSPEEAPPLPPTQSLRSRVYHKFCVHPSYLFTYIIRFIGKVFFLLKYSCPLKWGKVKQNSWKISKRPLVDSVNLCLKKPDTMQKESAQCDHPTRRKRPKSGPNLMSWTIVKISQYFSMFWTFFPGRVIRFSWFLLHCVRLLETQV